MKKVLPASKVLLSLLSLALLACSGGHTASEHLANAKRYSTESKEESAVLELKSALQKDGDLAEARWLLGELYLAAGDAHSAGKELQRALELGWPADQVSPPFARALLAQGEYLKLLRFPDRGLQNIARADVMASKALAAAALGEHKKSSRLIEQALTAAPTSVAALLAKARVLLNKGELLLASEITTAVIDGDSSNVSAWSILGDIRTAQSDSPEAIAAFSRALQLRGRDDLIRFKRSLLLLEEGNFEAASEDAKELLTRAPGHPGANYVEGIVQFTKGDYSKAIASLTAAEPAYSDLPLALLFMGSAHLMEGDLDQADIYATRFQDLAPQSIQGARLLATVRMQQARYKDVQQLLAPVLEASPNDVESLNLMSNALLQDGKTDQGIELLYKVAQLQPDSASAQTRLGAGLLMDGRSEDASRYIETALKLDPKFQQADILLIMNHLLKLEYDQAIESAQSYRRRNPLSTTALNILGRVYQAAGRHSKAAEAFNAVLNLDQGDPDANHNLAEMAESRNEPLKARHHYEAILASRDNYLPALLKLALLDAKNQDGPALEKRLQQALAAHPDAIEPKLLMGRYHISTGNPEKVASLFSNLAPERKKLPQVLQLVALAQLAVNENSSARYTLEQLLTLEPDSAETHHLLAVAAARTGDFLSSDEEIKRALEVDENHVPARVAAAKLALGRNHTKEFLQHLELLKSLAPDNAEVLLLQAAAARYQGNISAAIEHAKRAFIVAPVSATIQALAMYTEISGDRARAQNLYSTWLSQVPDDIEITLALAQSLQASGEVPNALHLYQNLLQMDPDNIVALNNVAWILRESEPVKALAYARKAGSLAPESASVLDTLGMVEFSNKEYRQAKRNLKRALELKPDDPSLIYHSAMIKVAQGEVSSAREDLINLFARTKDFAEFEEARALLDSLSVGS